ncbi:MAG: hypothetical protein HY315_04220 [Acidobacteria bacterium]|nr:hypothetical protein [Acidobacteriota bacterium]
MKRLLILSLPLAIAVLGDLPRAQEPRRSDEVKLVSIGRITSINLKKRSFELASEAPEGSGGGSGSATAGGADWPGGWHGGISVGIGVGRRGGLDGPRRGGVPGEPAPPWPGEDPLQNQTVRTIVKTTDETLYKDGGQHPSTFAGLKVGDAVEVTGVLRGRDIEAREIVRRGKE